jgi:hypothetical protein
MVKETGFGYDDTTVINMIDSAGLIGQQLFDPYDVAGWQRDRQWINTNFIIGRWLTSEMFLQRFYQDNAEQFRDLGLALSGNAGQTSNNPDLVAKPIIDWFTPKGLLTDADYDRAYIAFRSDVDVNYYEGGTQPSWTLLGWETGPSQVYLLLRHMSREPEFQLK